MKVLEKLLLEANKKNLARTLPDINAYIENHSRHRIDVEAICLLSIRDLLDARFTDQILRNLGYIFTIEQFKQDAASYLRLAGENPIRYNAHLKRLCRGYEALKQNYLTGNVHNKTVLTEMSTLFAETLLSYYCYGTTDSKKMPNELSARIAEMLQNEIKAFSENWFRNTLPNNLKKEFSPFLAEQLLQDWQNNNLAPVVASRLNDEKTQNLSVDALLTYFRDKKLPQDIHERIRTGIIEEVSRELRGHQITATNSPLGAVILNIRNTTIVNDNFHIISNIITDWQDRKTAPEVSEHLKKHIVTVIRGMQDSLHVDLAQQVAQLAVNTFLEKVQKAEYHKDAVENMHSYVGALAKQHILHMYAASNTLMACKDAVYNSAMQKLHTAWYSGDSKELSSKERKFINDTVFLALDELADKIQSKIWISNNSVDVNQLIKDNATMRTELTELKKLVEQLCDAKRNTNGGQSLAVVSDDKAIASSSLSFFSPK